MVDMVQMVGWPKDFSLDVDLDVEKKSALEKIKRNGQHQMFWTDELITKLL